MKALDAPDSKIRTSEPVTKETASQHPSSDATSEGVCLCGHADLPLCVSCVCVLDI